MAVNVEARSGEPTEQLATRIATAILMGAIAQVGAS
jgi:hypothetical protein